MMNVFAARERQTSTVKVTADILDAIGRAAEYYGNVSSLAKMMGVAHSTIIFWKSGKTSSISGRLWKTRIHPVLAPFLPSSKVKLQESPGQYSPQIPVIPPYMECRKVERHQVNVISVSVLKSFDPALETAAYFVRARCTEKRAFYHECRRTAFALKIDSLFTDVFPKNSYILAYPDGLQDGCMVICKLQGSKELLARRYSKKDNIITLSALPGDTCEDIVWDCEEEIGKLAWCFPLVELNLDLLPNMACYSYEHEDDADSDFYNVYDNEPEQNIVYSVKEKQNAINCPPERRGRKRKNAKQIPDSIS